MRTVPIGGLAVVAFAAGAVWATEPGRDERQLVTRYVTAWERGDYALMYGLLDTGSRRRTSEPKFVGELGSAAATATMTSIRFRHVASRRGNAIAVRLVLQTKLWGALDETLEVPLAGSGSGARIRLTGSLLFPGLRRGERLGRRIVLPPRGALLASDGTPLAQGPSRSSPIPDVAGQIVGGIGPIAADEVGVYAAQGVPAGANVGLNGLERVFQTRLEGKPGGQLLAGRRVLANASPVQAPAVRTTIRPALERATVAAMGGQYAGIAVMNPRTGALLALAGVAFSALQPPGSTMKIVTASGALEAGIVKLSTQFPIQTSTTLNGFAMQNANGEACGGTLLNAFAVSCNSVFAPLGAQLGAARLVSIAERFGFNQPSSIPGAGEPTIPSAGSIGDDLAVGSSAIGQGLVQSTALEQADIAATIAMGGRRPIPTLLANQPPRFVRVVGLHVAREVQKMMVAVVQYGTGSAAQIPGVVVAGKTGTAELKNTATNSGNPGPSSPKNTDAWFVAYAPVGHPRFAVGALFPNQGAGAATAAPPVHDILAAALGKG